MQLKVKPIFVLSKGENAFRNPDGTREIIKNKREVANRVAQLSQALREGLKFSGVLLQEALVRDEHELAELKDTALEADALLVYLIGAIPLEELFHWRMPIIAFSGQYTPTQALYALSYDRHSRSDVTIALDFKDIDEALQVLTARKKLQNTRAVLFGFPPPLFSRWLHLPDLELAKQKFGVIFVPVELRELVAEMSLIKEVEAQTVAECWLKEAKEVIEPSKSDVIEASRLYLAMASILDKEKANAMAINCLEMMSSLKAPPPCYALTRFRDEAIHAACEVDVIALLTMLLLGYLADKPAFMGNIVGAIPESNVLRISHDVVPTKMAGFGEVPKRYTLRNYHWSHGVTAYVELDSGQEVTIARLARSLDKILLINGELIECQDTTACRTTMSIKVNDARKFIQYAFGNHHVVVYGDLTRQVNALSRALEIETIEL